MVNNQIGLKDETEKTIDILARTLWGEARNQGVDGMMAVAWVVINRAKKPGWWGKTVIEICQKPSQFSCWLKNDPNYPKLKTVNPKTDKEFAEAINIASQIIFNHGKLTDPTRGATYYYEKHMATPPGWAAKLWKTAEIGDHIFFAESLKQ